MDALKDILRNLSFLRYFKSDWAKLVALFFVLVAFMWLNYNFAWYNLLIMAVFAIIVVYMKMHFDSKKHKYSLDAEVEKEKAAYKLEEAKYRNDDKLI